jgi:hypothetical protein
MSEPEPNSDRPEPVGPAAPRRVVADWEYRTAYVQFFQVRIPAELHDRLCEWARQERKPLGDLLIEALEEAVRRRGS